MVLIVITGNRGDYSDIRGSRCAYLVNACRVSLAIITEIYSLQSNYIAFIFRYRSASGQLEMAIMPGDPIKVADNQVNLLYKLNSTKAMEY